MHVLGERPGCRLRGDGDSRREGEQAQEQGISTSDIAPGRVILDEASLARQTVEPDAKYPKREDLTTPQLP